jgi:hypothetical protein
MHDGAPAHFSCAVQYVLNSTQCIASKLDKFESSVFLPSGTPKTPCVYTASVDNEEALHHHIVDACQKTICNYPRIFEWMWWSMMRFFKACTESHGGYTEHLL